MKVIRADVAVLGNEQTGKSTLINKFFGDAQRQSKQVMPTMMPEILTKRIKIPETNYQVELCVYDCPSHKLAQQFTSKCIAECKFVIILINALDKSTFEGAKYFLRYFRDATTIERPKGILVQNFSYEGRDEMTEDELQVFAGELGLLPARCSAANNRDIDLPFMMLAQLIYNIQTKNMK